MKKKWLLFISIASFALLLAACGRREAQTIEGFADIMEQAGFYVEHGGAGAHAFDAEGRFVINFQVFATTQEANRVFNEVRTDSEALATGAVTRSEVNMPGHNIYRMRSGGAIYRASRIDNTLVFVKANQEYADYVDDALDLLGYR